MATCMTHSGFKIHLIAKAAGLGLTHCINVFTVTWETLVIQLSAIDNFLQVGFAQIAVLSRST